MDSSNDMNDENCVEIENDEDVVEIKTEAASFYEFASVEDFSKVCCFSLLINRRLNLKN